VSQAQSRAGGQWVACEQGGGALHVGDRGTPARLQC
jgi:hypothetical protein